MTRAAQQLSDDDCDDVDDDEDDCDDQAVLSSLAPLLSKWQKETSDPWLCSPHAGPSTPFIILDPHSWMDDQRMKPIWSKMVNVAVLEKSGAEKGHPQCMQLYN